MKAPANRSTHHKLQSLLSNVKRRKRLEDEDIRFLLGLEDRNLIGRVFEAALNLRREHFGDSIFLYGFIYFSTFCSNDCIVLSVPQIQPALHRFRKLPGEILATAVRLLKKESISLTSNGEDPQVLKSDGGRWISGRITRAVKPQLSAQRFRRAGVADLLNQLAHAGADWYACYQETHTQSLFARLRLAVSFNAGRLNYQRVSKGFIEEGSFSGRRDSGRHKQLFDHDAGANQTNSGLTFVLSDADGVHTGTGYLARA
jgi:methylornithine synthase